MENIATVVEKIVQEVVARVNLVLLEKNEQIVRINILDHVILVKLGKLIDTKLTSIHVFGL